MSTEVEYQIEATREGRAIIVNTCDTLRAARKLVKWYEDEYDEYRILKVETTEMEL